MLSVDVSLSTFLSLSHTHTLAQQAGSAVCVSAHAFITHAVIHGLFHGIAL